MIRKIIGILLGLTLLTTVFAGCGKEKSTVETVTNTQTTVAEKTNAAVSEQKTEAASEQAVEPTSEPVAESKVEATTVTAAEATNAQEQEKTAAPAEEVKDNAVKAESGEIRDDFKGPKLDSAWKYTAAEKGPKYSFVDGKLRLDVPVDKAYDIWAGVNNGISVLRSDMGAGDWTIETKMNLTKYEMLKSYTSGLGVKFKDTMFFFGKIKADLLRFEKIGKNNIMNIPKFKSPYVSMKITKKDTKYTFEYKIEDKDEWSKVGEYVQEGEVLGVGVYAKTWAEGCDLSADFDYFTLAK